MHEVLVSVLLVCVMDVIVVEFSVEIVLQGASYEFGVAEFWFLREGGEYLCPPYILWQFSRPYFQALGGR